MLRNRASLSRPTVSIVTATLGRSSLAEACRSVDLQTFRGWHHYVIGDGILPREPVDSRRTVIGFSHRLGALEPGRNMPAGTPNPVLRWALTHLDLGDYVCFLDDDNLYRPDFLQEMLDTLEANSDAGVALCAAHDLRRARVIQGYPRDCECDNSAFLARSSVAKAIAFPSCDLTHQATQDCEFIELVAAKFGWVRVPRPLLMFGVNHNPPPAGGGCRVEDSWSAPVRAVELLNLGYTERAIRDLSAAIAFDRLDAWARWHLVEALLLSGEIGGAREVMDDWAELVPADGQDWLAYRQALRAHLGGNPEAATRALERAVLGVRANLHKEPHRAGEWFNFALYLLVSGKTTEAAHVFERALKTVSELVDVDNVIRDLRVLVAAGLLPGQSSQLLDRAISRRAAFRPSLLTGTFLLVAGEPEGAKRAYECAAALATYQEGREAMEDLGLLAAVGHGAQDAVEMADWLATQLGFSHD